MKRRIYITAARILVGVLFGLLLAWLLIFKPQADAKSTIRQQFQNYTSAIAGTQKASNLMSAMPDISAVGSQQPGNFASYTSDCNNRLKQLDKISINSQRPHKIFSVRSQPVIRDVNSSIAQSSEDKLVSSSKVIEQARSLMTYHCSVMAALVNILEYDPAGDTQGFQLGSDDTNQRLTLAREGLAKTAGKLNQQNGRYKDMALVELETQISSLQTARDQLAKDGNKDVWISVVTAVQSSIAANRKMFWQKNSALLDKTLLQDEPQLAKNQNIWYNLTIKYKLN